MATTPTGRGTSTLVGANDEVLQVTASPVTARVKLAAAPTAAPAAAAPAAAERLYLNVEGVRGTLRAVFFPFVLLRQAYRMRKSTKLWCSSALERPVQPTVRTQATACHQPWKSPTRLRPCRRVLVLQSRSLKLASFSQRGPRRKLPSTGSASTVSGLDDMSRLAAFAVQTSRGAMPWLVALSVGSYLLLGFAQPASNVAALCGRLNVAQSVFLPAPNLQFSQILQAVAADWILMVVAMMTPLVAANLSYVGRVVHASQRGLQVLPFCSVIFASGFCRACCLCHWRLSWRLPAPGSTCRWRSVSLSFGACPRSPNGPETGATVPAGWQLSDRRHRLMVAGSVFEPGRLVCLLAGPGCLCLCRWRPAILP